MKRPGNKSEQLIDEFFGNDIVKLKPITLDWDQYHIVLLNYQKMIRNNTLVLDSHDKYYKIVNRLIDLKFPAYWLSIRNLDEDINGANRALQENNFVVLNYLHLKNIEPSEDLILEKIPSDTGVLFQYLLEIIDIMDPESVDLIYNIIVRYLTHKNYNFIKISLNKQQHLKDMIRIAFVTSLSNHNSYVTWLFINSQIFDLFQIPPDSNSIQSFILDILDDIENLDEIIDNIISPEILLFLEKYVPGRYIPSVDVQKDLINRCAEDLQFNLDLKKSPDLEFLYYILKYFDLSYSGGNFDIFIHLLKIIVPNFSLLSINKLILLNAEEIRQLLISNLRRQLIKVILENNFDRFVIDIRFLNDNDVDISSILQTYQSEIQNLIYTNYDKVDSELIQLIYQIDSDIFVLDTMIKYALEADDINFTIWMLKNFSDEIFNNFDNFDTINLTKPDWIRLLNLTNVDYDQVYEIVTLLIFNELFEILDLILSQDFISEDVWKVLADLLLMSRSNNNMILFWKNFLDLSLDKPKIISNLAKYKGNIKYNYIDLLEEGSYYIIIILILMTDIELDDMTDILEINQYINNHPNKFNSDDGQKFIKWFKIWINQNSIQI